MKRFWIVIAILAVVGICFTVSGAVAGANVNGFYFDNNGLHMYSGETTLVQERELDAFYDIYIDVQSADIKFVQSDDYGFEFNSRVEQCFNYSYDNGALVITRPDGWYHDFMRFSLGAEQEYITIFIPQSARLNDVEIKSVSGRIDIDAVQCSTFHVNQISGNTTIGSIIAGDVSMTATSGKIHITHGEANTFYFRLVSGNLTASYLESGGLNADLTSGKADLSGVFSGNTRVHAVSGSVKLTTRGTEQQYNRNIAVVSGHVSINGTKAGAGNVNYHAGNTLDISTVSGNISITFAS